MIADIRASLVSRGLGPLAELLIGNEVDLEALPEPGETRLKELGIALGPRVKLLKSIAGLRAIAKSLEPEASRTRKTRPGPRV